jgi:hypothetical protein
VARWEFDLADTILLASRNMDQFPLRVAWLQGLPSKPDCVLTGYECPSPLAPWSLRQPPMLSGSALRESLSYSFKERHV